MKIIIGFSKPHKWKPFSALIMWYTKAPFSHAYIKYRDEFTGQLIIAESSHGESHKITEENWKVKNKRVHAFELEVLEDEMRLMIIHINNYLQTKYSIKNIFGKPFYDLYLKTNFKLFKKIAEIFADNNNGQICSEAVAYLLALRGFKFFGPLDFLSPKDVFEKLVLESHKYDLIKQVY